MEKMTMAENSKAKTSVWWDIENCEVPKGWDAHGIAQNVASALLNMNYSGTVSILAYGDTNLIPHHVQQALSSTGVGLHHVPAGVKDASDKKILVDMLLWAIDNPAPANIMLISGDRDFSNALHQLSMRRYTILLAQPPRASAPLVSAAKNVWLWTSLASGGPPLTSGEESSQSSKPTGSTSVAGDSNDHKTRDNHVPRGATGESVTSCDKSHTSQCYKAHDSVSAKPIHEADVVEPVLCTVCKISCSSKEAYANHIYSKKHRNNLELQSGKVENVSKKKARGGGRTRPNAGYACRLCNVKCQTQVVYDSHLKGQKHAAMVTKLDQALTDSKKLQEKGVGEKSKPRGVSPETQLQSQNTQGNTKWLEKQSKELRELLLGTSESSVKEKLPRTQEPALTVNKRLLNEEARECSEGAADNYSREMKKKQKEVMEHRAITPISKLCHLCVVICDSQGVSTLVCDSKHHWTNQKDAFVASDDAVWCSLCQISFNNKAAYANHTNGKKHLKKLKLQSAENENMSKGQAKTSEDNAERMKKSKDQTTFDSQNLKDQTEELKEILLGTSERSVKENLPRTKDQGETVNKQILNEEARECFVEVKKKQKEVMECQAVRVRHKLCHQCVVICDSQGVSTRVCGKKYHWPNQMKDSVDSRRIRQELDKHKLREESDQGAQEDKEEVKEIHAVSENLATVFNGLKLESRIHRESRGCLDVIPERVQVPPDESEHKQEREKECGKESKKVQVDSLWTRLWLGKT